MNIDNSQMEQYLPCDTDCIVQEKYNPVNLPDFDSELGSNKEIKESKSPKKLFKSEYLCQIINGFSYKINNLIVNKDFIQGYSNDNDIDSIVESLSIAQIEIMENMPENIKEKYNYNKLISDNISVIFERLYTINRILWYDVKNILWTELLIACYLNHYEAVEYLTKHNLFDIDLIFKEGNNKVNCFILSVLDREKIYKIFTSHKKFRASFYEFDSYGVNILHFAIISNNIEILKDVLEHITEQTYNKRIEGYTCLEFALKLEKNINTIKEICNSEYFTKEFVNEISDKSILTVICESDNIQYGFIKFLFDNDMITKDLFLYNIENNIYRCVNDRNTLNLFLNHKYFNLQLLDRSGLCLIDKIIDDKNHIGFLNIVSHNCITVDMINNILNTIEDNRLISSILGLPKITWKQIPLINYGDYMLSTNTMVTSNIIRRSIHDIKNLIKKQVVNETILLTVHDDDFVFNHIVNKQQLTNKDLKFLKNQISLKNIDIHYGKKYTIFESLCISSTKSLLYKLLNSLGTESRLTRICGNKEPFLNNLIINNARITTNCIKHILNCPYIIKHDINILVHIINKLCNNSQKTASKYIRDQISQILNHNTLKHFYGKEDPNILSLILKYVSKKNNYANIILDIILDQNLLPEQIFETTNLTFIFSSSSKLINKFLSNDHYDSKYITIDMLLNMNKNNSCYDCLNTFITHNKFKKNILTSELFVKWCKVYPKICISLLDNKLLDKKIFQEKIDGKNCLCVTESYDLFKQIINYKYFTKKMFDTDILLQLNDWLQIEYFINSKYCTLDIITNNKKENNIISKIFSDMTQFNLIKIKIIELILNKFGSEELLLMPVYIIDINDSNNQIEHIQSLVQLIVCFDIFKSIINKKFFTEECFNQLITPSQNYLNHYIKESDYDTVKSILDNKNCPCNILDDFLIHCNNIRIFKLILDSGKMTPEHIYKETGKNKIYLSDVIYKKDSIKYIKLLVKYNMIGNTLFDILLTKYNCNLYNWLINNNEIGIFRYLLTKKVFSTEKIFCDNTHLSDVIGYNDEKTVKTILNLTTDISPLFTCSALIIATGNENLSILKMLMESKYFMKDMLFEYDQEGNNVITTMFSIMNIDIIKYLIDSEYWQEILQIYCDHYDTQIFLNDEISNMILEKNDILFELKDSFGETILHKIIKFESNHISKILKLCTPEYFKTKNKLNQNCLHISCEFSEENSKLILENKFCNSEFLGLQDMNGRTSLMISILNKLDLVETFATHKNMTNEIINTYDNYGNTCITYLIRVYPKKLHYIFDNFDVNISHVNNHGNGYLAYASRYSSFATKYLLSLNKFKQNMVYNHHYGKNNAYLIASRYQPDALEELLKWEHYDNKLLNCIDKRENFNILQISCKYNARSLKYLLKNVNIKHLLNTKIPSIALASKYQPDAVKMLLESKYNDSIDLYSEYEDMNCPQLAFTFQPQSLINMMCFEKCTDEILNEPNEIGYTLLSKLKCINPEVNSVRELETIFPITNNANIFCETDNSCTICCEFKKRVIFSPCSHQICIACSVRSNKCPICRNIITKRNLIY